MHVIRTENNNRALVISAEKWKSFKNIITEKNDDITANNEIEKLKNERKAASKAITESWATTKMNQQRKAIEKKQKLLADIEAMKVKRDEEIKLEVLERRNEIVKKMRLKIWSERDSTKAMMRALHSKEVLREREMQIKFNEAERIRIAEEDRLQNIEINRVAEQYRKDQLKEKLKHAEIKKANASFMLKELKERENIRRNLALQLRQGGEAELQRIAKEIDEDTKEKKAKIISAKEVVLKNLREHRESVAKKMYLQKLEEDEENMVISIIDKAKRKIGNNNII